MTAQGRQGEGAQGNMEPRKADTFMSERFKADLRGAVIPHALEIRAGLCFIAGDGGAPMLHPVSLTNKSRHPDHSTGKAEWATATLAALVERYNAAPSLLAERDALRARVAGLEAALEAVVTEADQTGGRDRMVSRYTVDRARAALAGVRS